MSRFEHIKIFNNNGDALQLDTNGNLFWYEKLNFNRISSGMFESMQLFIFEETNEGLNYPKSNYTNAKWRIRLDDIKPNLEDNNFFFYEVDWNAEFPEIIRKTELIISLEDGHLLSVDSNNKLLYGNDKKPLIINIGFTGTDTNVFTNNILIEEIIEDNNVIKHNEENADIFYKNDSSWTELIGWIEVYGETKGEDIRYKNLLENLGIDVPQDKWYLFKDTEIEDDNINWNIINAKRKELLLEHSNIFPYIGSYKGLRNILNWLGWNDLSVREFWKNIKTNQRGSQEIWNSKDVFTTNNLSSLWKKTGEISLTYPLNKETENSDEYGYPIVEDANQYSIDEVLFKLWGIKSYLQNEFLPLGTKIIDITGEGVYFEKYQLHTWTNKLQIFNSNIPKTLSYSYKTDGIINDWSKLYKKWNEGKSGNEIDNVANSNLKISDLFPNTLDSIDEKFLLNFFNTTYNFFPANNYNSVIGCPIQLNNKSFQMDWNSFDSTWDELTNVNWNDIQWGDFYEMEWIIEKKDLPNVFTLSSGRKNISELFEWNCFVPYSGKWTVILKMWNSTNAIYEKVWLDDIEIRNHKIELGLITKYYKNSTSWNNTTTTWDNLNTSWNTFGIGNISESNTIPYDYLSMGTYAFDNVELLEENTYDDFYKNRLGKNIYWDKLDTVTWNDLNALSWDNYNINGGVYCGFNIMQYTTGGTIECKGYTDVFTTSATNWMSLLDELENTSIKWLKQFDYQVVKPTNVSTTWFIRACAKNFSINNLFLLKFDNGIEGEDGLTEINTYPKLNWNTWSGTEFPYNIVWRGYNQFLRNNNEGHDNSKWNDILSTKGTNEYYNEIRKSLYPFISDWINENDSWIQTNKLMFKNGNPLIINTYPSMIPNFKIDSLEIIIESDRKLKCKPYNSFIYWTPMEDNDIEVAVSGKDGNNNEIKDKFIIKKLL